MRPIYVLQALLMALVVALPPGSALTTTVGIGEAYYAGCTSTDKYAIVGSDDGFGFWTFVVADRNTETCPFLSGDVFIGFWSPAFGGCVFSFVGYLCLTDPVPVGTMTSYTLSTSLGGTLTGTAVLSFTTV